MRYKILIAFLTIAIVFSTDIFARIIIPPIHGPIIKKISVFVPELSNVSAGGTDGKAREFINVIRNDLLNAGFFDVHDASGVSTDGSGNINFQAFFDAGAEALVKGEYQSSGDRINVAIRLFDVVQERELLGRSYEANSGRVREAAHRFANAVMKELTGIDGFFTSKIVFVSGTGQNRDLYIMDYDGHNAKRLTSHRSIILSPDCSSDGTKVVFNSDKVWSQDIYAITLSPQIYIMNSNGSNVRRITSGGYNTDPSWSPNMSVNRISFVRVEGSEANIFTVNPDGSDSQKLTSGSRRNENPAWSPDGHYIAFGSNRDGAKNIYIMYLNGENQRSLTKGGGKSFPTWCR